MLKPKPSKKLMPQHWLTPKQLRPKTQKTNSSQQRLKPRSRDSTQPIHDLNHIRSIPDLTRLTIVYLTFELHDFWVSLEDPGSRHASPWCGSLCHVSGRLITNSSCGLQTKFWQETSTATISLQWALLIGIRYASPGSSLEIPEVLIFFTISTSWNQESTQSTKIINQKKGKNKLFKGFETIQNPLQSL